MCLGLCVPQVVCIGLCVSQVVCLHTSQHKEAKEGGPPEPPPTLHFSRYAAGSFRASPSDIWLKVSHVTRHLERRLATPRWPAKRACRPANKRVRTSSGYAPIGQGLSTQRDHSALVGCGTMTLQLVAADWLRRGRLLRAPENNL